MVRINCQTFDQFWEVTVTMVNGLKETPVVSNRYNKMSLVSSASEAIRDTLSQTYSYVNADIPDHPEHS